MAGGCARASVAGPLTIEPDSLHSKGRDAMASEAPIVDQIRSALAQHLKRDVAKIRPGDRLREDLGLDSLAMIELLFKIEEHFDLEIPNEDLSRITTVADVATYVEEKLGQHGTGTRAPAAPAAPPQPAAVAAPPASASPTERQAREPMGHVAQRAAAPARRTPAKVTSIKAAAKAAAQRRSAGGKTSPAKKKGSRRA